MVQSDVGGENMLVAVGASLTGIVIWWRFLYFLDFFDFLPLIEETGVLVWRRWPEVWSCVWEVVVWIASAK